MINSCNKKLFTGISCLFIISAAIAQEPVMITGIASYCHNKFNGRKRANGEIFYNDSLTTAHKTLPFGTIVKVIHFKNNNQVIVRINDRLPASSKRT